MQEDHDIRNIFSAFDKLFDFIGKQNAKVREQRKLRRQAKARARYAARKAAGTLPKKKQYEPERDRETPTSCTCSHPNSCPPCWFCTHQDEE